MENQEKECVWGRHYIPPGRVGGSRLNTKHSLGDGGELLVETAEVDEVFESQERGLHILQQDQPPSCLI